MRQSRPSMFFPCDSNIPIVTTKCMLSVPSSTSDLHYSRWQSGELCQRLSAGAFTLLCHVLLSSMKVCSSFFLSCLALSLLCRLTLRPSTPVCFCHPGSLTRGRMAFQQEAVRVCSSHSPRLVLHVVACAWWFRAAFEKCLFKRR